MRKNTRGNRSDLRDMLGFYQSFAKQHRAFGKEEDGAITIFACFMVFCMLMVTGIGVDMMRHEMERTRIQAVADRAVLAAADLDQTLDSEAVVRDYFEKAGMADLVANVYVSPPSVNARIVSVEAEGNVPTMFMDYLGVDEIYVGGNARAEERVNSVEISMVLDISGSMRHNDKMPNLRTAAGSFIDAVIKEDTVDRVSVNVVPYTAQVNAGEDIFNLMNVEDYENLGPDEIIRSHCVDFEDDDFDDTSIYFGEVALRDPYEHMPHFEASYSWLGNYSSDQFDRITNPGCPKQDFEVIQAFSQDPLELKANIDQFQPRANTSIHLGMKWGVAMLDPEWRKFNAVLPGVDDAFRGRPSNYNDPETLKTIILMTDGINVTTRRIRESKYNSAAWRQFWSNMPLYGTLQQYNVNWSDYYYTKYTPTQADGLLENICDAAKLNNIIVWSIGFEVDDHGADVMRDCASSPSHFFRVEGVEISEAFDSIARQINQLRLTQ